MKLTSVVFLKNTAALFSGFTLLKLVISIFSLIRLTFAQLFLGIGIKQAGSSRSGPF